MSVKRKKFSISARLKSFRYAFNGLVTLFREEHNSRIHLLASGVVVLAGFYFNISPFEWLAITFAIGFVFVTEIINSSIENLSDVVSPERSEAIKKVKDLAAAAVLFSAFVALVVAAVIFVPRF